MLPLFAVSASSSIVISSTSFAHAAWSWRSLACEGRAGSAGAAAPPAPAVAAFALSAACIVASKSSRADAEGGSESDFLRSASVDAAVVDARAEPRAAAASAAACRFASRSSTVEAKVSQICEGERVKL